MNAYIWALVQDGPLEDPKGKLSLMTFSNLQSLLVDPQTWYVESAHSYIDFLELFRISLIQSQVPMQQLSEKIYQHLSGDKICLKIKFWMSLLMTHVVAQEDKDKWSKLTNLVAKNALLDSAKSILKSPPL